MPKEPKQPHKEDDAVELARLIALRNATTDVNDKERILTDIQHIMERLRKADGEKR
jgi:hypothetical protein